MKESPTLLDGNFNMAKPSFIESLKSCRELMKVDVLIQSAGIKGDVQYGV